MRFVTTSLVGIMVAVAFTGCSGSRSSNGTAASSADATAAAALANGAAPIYPGASLDTTDVSVSHGTNVYSTPDALDKVDAWYQKNLPPGSEQAHTATFSLFMVGKHMIALHILPGKTTVSISSK